MFTFSSVLLGDLGGSKQGLGAFSSGASLHLKYGRRHLPVVQYEKLGTRKLKGIYEQSFYYHS